MKHQKLKIYRFLYLQEWERIESKIISLDVLLHLFALWWTETGREEFRIERKRGTQSPSCVIHINITLFINSNIKIMLFINIEINIDINEESEVHSRPPASEIYS